jgi:excisionase family DNA binding protein
MQRRLAAMPEKRAYSVKEIAHELDCDHKTVRKGIESGTIPSIRIGRLIRIPEWWISQNLNGPSAPTGKAA